MTKAEGDEMTITIESVGALARQFRQQEVVKTIVVRDEATINQLHQLFPSGELRGIRVLLDETVPPGTAYLIADVPHRGNPAGGGGHEHAAGFEMPLGWEGTAASDWETPHES